MNTIKITQESLDAFKNEKDVWLENEVCNHISDSIHEYFREENNGYDSDVFVDEVIEDGVIALNWHTYLDSYVTTDYVNRVAAFVFEKFPEVKTIMSPCKDYERN